uniref:Uncharacterized protein n=1 Tax=Chromera velia CCMP2878 TaxID=1169474 RepID=A0A0G4HRI0_9ALVE|eukprot:Cvel_1282.t1-p1 / transcript=Cvel_1282.t1 / gene=Cvel_1282 / organism=Chromera_velia_CCMP2878 / gene_product=hypothetical protein / transcript_product=hypothetical protein / location=Cvel_scaffold43:47225-47830(+) / protein_length=202 / sequence_SO=supercontig / SO=protein_coding / is_pseudo=false
MLVNVVCRDLGIPLPPADFSLPQASFEKESPPPPPRVTATLTGLSEVIETTLQSLKKEAHSKLDQILSEYYKIDLSPLFASKVGNVIRSFQAVDTETLRQAVWACANAEPEGMDDLRLLLRVGANFNALAKGKAALLNAVCAGSLPAVEMLIEEGASLQRGGEVEYFEGFTALHHACFEVRPDIVRFLILRRAHVNTKDKIG